MDEDDLSTESGDSGNALENVLSADHTRNVNPVSTKRQRLSEGTENARLSPPPLKRVAISKPESCSASTRYASPFRLITIHDLPASANVDTLSLHDLLGDPLIKECWLFDFLFNVDFIMKHFDKDVQSTVQVNIVHGSWKTEDENRIRIEEACTRLKNVRQIRAWMSEMYGTHHSKMMILIRHDDCAQVIIHTANMIAKDWTNMTQGIWQSPMLQLYRSQSASRPTDESEADSNTRDQNLPSVTTNAIGSGARFKGDLQRYLSSYVNKRGDRLLSKLITQLRDYDFGSIRAALIASVPGSVPEQSQRRAGETSWGWLGLREVLSQVSVRVTASETPCIVAQVSSIATLTDNWINHFLASLCFHQGSGSTLGRTPDRRIMFPTAREVRNSLDGYQAGGSIHFKTQSARQQAQLAHMRPRLVRWAGEEVIATDMPSRTAGRRRAAPHIKTYTRFTSQNIDRIDWAMITSANLSTQAWGGLPKDGHVRISSYEIGVVVWPALFDDLDDPASKTAMVPTFGQDMPTLVDSMEKEVTQLVGIRTPYDAPLVPYKKDDQPWVATASYDEPDWKGVKWSGWG